jgi:uncharacterized protein DUF6896
MVTAGDLTARVAEFLRLQDGLLRALHRSAGPALGHETPGMWPSAGELEVDGVRWSYRKHGLGYTFEETAGGRLVEAHDFITAPPFPIDAYRLQCYLESLGESEVSLGDQRFATADIHALQRGLAALRDRGDLRLNPRTASWPLQSFFPVELNAQ